MALYISPKHLEHDFTHGMTLNDKIDVFAARVEGWQLGVARAIIDKDIPDREFVLLHIVMNYFEMIAKYRAGYTKDGQSKDFFRQGVRTVFPEIDTWPPDVFGDFITALYSNVRCGLYHIGMPKPTVIVTDVKAIAPIRYYPDGQKVILNPDKLVQVIQAHFAEYISALKNVTNVEIRTNFEARFNVDNNC